MLSSLRRALSRAHWTSRRWYRLFALAWSLPCAVLGAQGVKITGIHSRTSALSDDLQINVGEVRLDVKNNTPTSLWVWADAACGPFFDAAWYDVNGNAAPLGCWAMGASIQAGATSTVSLFVPLFPYTTGNIKVNVGGGAGADSALISVAVNDWNGTDWTASFLPFPEATFTPRITHLTSANVGANGRRSTALTISNAGSAQATFTFTASCSGTVTNCNFSAAASDPSATTRTLAAGASSTLTAYYTTGPVGSTGQLRVKMTAPPRASGLVEADSSTLAVTAADLAAPTISTQPFGSGMDSGGNYWIPADTATIAVVYCDADGTLGTPTLKVSGATVPPATLTATAQVGCATSSRATYKPVYLDGYGPVVASVSDGYHTSTQTTWYKHDGARQSAARIVPLHPTISAPINSVHVDTFVVTNPGPETVVYDLSLFCSANPWTLPCSMSSSYSSVSLAPSVSVSVPVSYSLGAVGSSVTPYLYAAFSGYLDTSTTSAHFTASAVGTIAPIITVTPATGTVVTSSPINQIRVDWCDADDGIAQHDLTWQGQALPNTYVATTRSGCYAAGSSTYSNLSINLWQQSLVATATDLAGHSVTTTTTITYSPPLTNFAPHVAASADWHRLPGASAVTAADTFTVTNSGSYAAAYTLTALCGGTATLTSCATNKGSVSLVSGASEVVVVTYTRSGPLDRADTLKLVASFTSPLGAVVADTGRKVVVAPSIEAVPIVAGTQSSFSLSPTVVMSTSWFTLRNTSSMRTRYQLTWATSGGFNLRVGGDTLSVDAGQIGYPPASVIAPSTAGANGTLTVTASYVATTGQTLAASATVQLTTTASPSGGIALNVSGSSTPLLAPNASGTVSFTVQNTGGSAAAVSYARACSGTAIAVCGALSHATASLAANQSDIVTVNVTAGSVGGQSGTVTLTATSGSIVASGGVTVVTGVARGPLTISTGAQLNPGTSMARDRCLTIAAGDDGAYECGDLRLAHRLPATRTMNAERSPTLIYESGQAHPVSLVAADVSVDGTICPTQLIARVMFSNSDTAQRTVDWNGACGQSASRRIVVPIDAAAHSHGTGVYHYTFEVRTSVNGTAYTVSDTGSLVVVSRAAGKFGAGWWVDGLEELYPVAGRVDQMLWIGGDGSSRLYTQQPGTTAFLVQPTIDRPDTLEQLAGGAGYKRHLRNGAYVLFSNILQHSATVNSSGHVTRFYWSPTQLDSILLPAPNSGTTTARRLYRFTYASGLLASITSPASPNGARVTSLTRTAIPGGIDLSVTDPGADAAVHYVSDAAGRMILRKNRLTDGTRYGYDSIAGVLTSIAIDLTRTSLTTDSIRTTICPAEASSIARCAPLIDPAGVRTVLDGPRTDVADVTSFYLNTLGAPRAIVNALGYTTTIEHSDSRWPALVTAVVQPNGHRVTATYTDRGLIAAQRDSNPYGDGRIALTQYQWNATYDEPDVVTGPTGETARFGYDQNGDRQWEEDGRGLVSRVQYSYAAGTRQLATIQPPGNSLLQVQRFAYDTLLGNLIRETSPLGMATDHVRDALGRDTLTLTPTDAAQTPALKQALRIVYDLRDLVDTIVAAGPAVGYTLRSTSTYPAFVTADTAFTSHRYDGEGHLTSTFVKAGFSVNGERQIATSEAWTYDAAGRVQVHSRNQVPDSTTYDPAGNVLAFKTGGGGGYTQQFDPLDRLVQRTVASKTYTQQRCDGLIAGPITDPRYAPYCLVVFPAYPNSGTSYVTPADVASFAYDANGNVLTADNNDARVHRQYYPNGAVRLDSTLYRSVAGTAFVHGTGIAVHYDLGGRRDTLTLPGGQTISYAYQPTNGALSTVTDPAGNLYRYTYDGAGRIDSIVIGGGGVREHRWYDADGRQYARQRVSAVLGQLSSETLTLDARGRVTVADYTTAANGTPHERTYLAYSGLGAVLSRERTADDGNWQTEEFRVDALGNVLRSRSESRDVNSNMPLTSTYSARGALKARFADGNPDWPLAFDSLAQVVDGDGNVITSHHTGRDRNNVPTVDTPTRSYYGADGRLRAVQRYNLVGADEAGTWEEYRYDAFGRRVEVIARPGGVPPACATVSGICTLLCSVGPCPSTATWVMYDGDQIVQEERRAYTGNDFGDLSAPHYGIIKHVHGLELDKPLALIDQSQSIHVLNLNWRGLFESSVAPSGIGADCSLIGGTCQRVAWPAGNLVYARPAPVETNALTLTWLGSLATDQQDGTGQLYRRNRYYDPDAGRFTQEDPVGFGGGGNLYGFAGGDPVNFSDPFGLCPVVGLMAGPIIGGATAAWCGAEILALGATAALVWFSKSKTSGETPAAAGGREAHKTWDPGPGFQKEIRLPSGKRCDALNPETCEIKELKPENERARRRGERQLENYKRELEEQTGKEHKTKLETYKPKQP